MPLLKGEDVLQLAARMGLDGSQLAQDNIMIQWNNLLNLCEAEQRLSDLLKLLVYTFPVIKDDALIVRLRGQVG